MVHPHRPRASASTTWCAGSHERPRTAQPQVLSREARTSPGTSGRHVWAQAGPGCEFGDGAPADPISLPPRCPRAAGLFVPFDHAAGPSPPVRASRGRHALGQRGIAGALLPSTLPATRGAWIMNRLPRPGAPCLQAPWAGTGAVRDRPRVIEQVPPRPWRPGPAIPGAGPSHRLKLRPPVRDVRSGTSLTRASALSPTARRWHTIDNSITWPPRRPLPQRPALAGRSPMTSARSWAPSRKRTLLKHLGYQIR